jgi:acyl dehydratase
MRDHTMIPFESYETDKQFGHMSNDLGSSEKSHIQFALHGGHRFSVLLESFGHRQKIIKQSSITLLDFVPSGTVVYKTAGRHGIADSRKI